MSIRIERHAEPIPGYRLIERIGGGGFGEVWKAEAPGGLHKAIKFVYGDLEEASEDGVRAEQELKAMNRVIGVRHPYILSLERFDIIDGQLIIVMELADRNLWDRFKECRAAGMIGIPRGELLGYMLEAAEALDLMNNQYQLQHLDIKPQNLFLVHQHIKVADFGLVKDLEGKVASLTGGVTPIYAAPETFEGYVSRFSDQYSLAIVYQELLTGQRPINGANVRQLIMQHLQGVPDLTPLPPPDRAPIQRALAKHPDERHPTCVQLFQLLAKGEGIGTPLDQTPFPADRTAPRLETQDPGSATPTADGDVSLGPDGNAAVDSDGDNPTTQCTVRKAKPAKAQETIAPEGSPSISPQVGDGELFPALVIGLGAQGSAVLHQLRECLHLRFGSADALPNVRFLAVDTDPAARVALQHGTPTALDPSQLLLARLNRPSHYLKARDGRAIVDGWLNPKMLYRIPRTHMTTGLRALGRLAFCDNYPLIIRRLRSELQACTNPDAMAQAMERNQLGLRTNQPRIYLVTSLAGGTGSGMFLDFAYVLRRLVRDLGYGQPDIVGLFLLPQVGKATVRPLPLGNAYAALTELNHFSSPDTTFSARYVEEERPLKDDGPPFQRCAFLPLPPDNDEAAKKDLLQSVGEFLSLDLASQLGRVADLSRSAFDSPEPQPQLSFQTFSLCRIRGPWAALRTKLGLRFCQHLIKRWLDKDAEPIRESITQWVGEQIDELRLGPEFARDQLHAECVKVLEKSPNEAFAALTHKVNPRDRTLTPMDAANTLASLDTLIGCFEDDTLWTKAIGLAAVLRDTSDGLAKEWCRKLVELPALLIEQPDFRLAGAEEAVRHIAAAVEKAIQGFEGEVKKLAARIASASERIRQILGIWQKGSASGVIRIPPIAAELPSLLDDYANSTYQRLLLFAVIRLSISVRGQVSDYLREVNFCRSRLLELLKMLRSSDTSTATKGVEIPGWNLYPGRSQSLDEAVNKVINDMPEDDLRTLDANVQKAIRQRFGTLAQVCLAPANRLTDVKAAMMIEAERFANDRLGGSSVVNLFVEQCHSEEKAHLAISRAFAEAQPDPMGMPEATHAEIRIVATPEGPEGERFRQMARAALPDEEVAFISFPESIVFYRELTNLPLADLPQVGSVAEKAYRQLTSVDHLTPHTRIDISAWQPAAR